MRLILEAWRERQEDAIELKMAGAYYTGMMTHWDPKKYPAKFTDFYKRRRREPTRQQSDEELWRSFNRFARMNEEPV